MPTFVPLETAIDVLSAGEQGILVALANYSHLKYIWREKSRQEGSPC